MALINLNKLPEIVPQFVNERLVPNAPVHIQGALVASLFILSHSNYKVIFDLIEAKKPMLIALGILNENNQLDIDLAKGALDAFFTKAPSYKVMNFVLNQEDSNALITILEQHKD